MFDIDELIEECRAARADAEPRRAVREVIERAVSSAADVAAELRPTEAGITVLHRSDDLTVSHVVWAPGMRIVPHDHRVWAAIGIYTGREDNSFYRRTGAGVTESGGRSVSAGDVLMLGDDVVHGVSNPGATVTGGIHVYGGDLIAQTRSQWGPGPLVEHPYDVDEVDRLFAAANAAWVRDGVARPT